MVAILNSAVLTGLVTTPLTIEVDIASGLPAIHIVGLADKAVTESKERIRSALRSSGFEFPLGRITINLAPADSTKSGSAFDLAIALGVLHKSGIVKQLEDTDVFIGELSLTGEVKPVSSLLPLIDWAQKSGKNRIFIPKASAKELFFQPTIEVFPVGSLSQLVDFLLGKNIVIEAFSLPANQSPTPHYEVDFADVQGQELAKRALTIAAAGGHNLIMVGDPGSGKSMLAKALPSILPALAESELFEINMIYSAAGLSSNHGVVSTRPFRSPHHSSSHISIVGGGINLRPGEITLAHRGVLFLDEFPEFSRLVIETLRQPMEDGVVTIARASGSVTYPARAMIIAAANPTPHGTNAQSGIEYNDARTRTYRQKFSGPIMDRFDLFVKVSREHGATVGKQTSEQIRSQVTLAHEEQQHRFASLNAVTNAEVSAKLFTLFNIQPDALALLETAALKHNLSLRAQHKTIKVARTIADLAQSKEVLTAHIVEALQFRQTLLF